ncbi:MAG: hypothetical protein AAF629_16100 [Chloroflexota bacterium]
MIILIEGPINAGKTTISRLLSETIPNTAHVKVDDLRHFVSWMSLEDAIPFALENAACVTTNFVRAGLHVIIDYPLDQDDYDFLYTQFQQLNTPVYCFTLRPNLDVNLTNRGKRILTDRERRRIREQHQSRQGIPAVGYKIDNSAQTVQNILDILNV